MDLHDAYNQIDNGVKNNSVFLDSPPIKLKSILIIVGILLFFSWYVYLLIFKGNSYFLVQELQMEKKELRLEISELQNSNTKLQRTYFNLKLADESYRDGL